MKSCADRVAASLIAVQLGLLAWSGYRHSPVLVEPAHLAAGVAHLQRGRFDLYRVNPPLVRTVAAAPVLLADARTDWARDHPDPLLRREFDVGADLLRANGRRSLGLVTLARWACLVFPLVGGLCVYRWSRELFGAGAGVVALAVWCFNPDVLGHAALITPDAHASSLAVAAGYAFYRWRRNPAWGSALLAGLVLGLALLTKTTLLLLYPAFGLAWLGSRSAAGGSVTLRREVRMVATLCVLSVAVLNLGYGMEGSLRRLDSFQLQSRFLFNASERGERLGLGWLPVPAPANFVQGIDAQRLDFERGLRSYLDGRWSDKGWPCFYLAAAMYKTPLGTLLLFVVAVTLALTRPEYRTNRAAELTLLLPPAFIWLMVSSQTGFSLHPRYTLPALPFLIVAASRGGRSLTRWRSPVGRLTLTGVAASAASALWCYPHELSYFNEAVGGPRHGHFRLLDSGLAWGQDLVFLKEWLDENGVTSPCELAAFGYVNPDLLGIDYCLPAAPLGPVPTSTYPDDFARSEGERLLILDVNHLMGSPDPAPAPPGDRQMLRLPAAELESLRSQAPLARVGYSFFIFRRSAAIEDPPRRSAAGVQRMNPGARGWPVNPQFQRSALGEPRPAATCNLQPPGVQCGGTRGPRAPPHTTGRLALMTSPDPDDGGHADAHSNDLSQGNELSQGGGIERSRTSTSLLCAVRAEDQEGWRRLVDEHQARIYRWCRRAGLDESDAADVAQEVFIAVARGISTFRRDRPGDSLRKWLRAITTCKINDYWRARGKVEGRQGGTAWLRFLNELAMSADQSATGACATPDAGDARCAAIQLAREEAKPRDWLIFERTVIDEVSPRDVAEEHGVSVNVVYLTKSRVLKRVRHWYDVQTQGSRS